MPTDPIPFESFPRRALPLGVKRRKMLSTLYTEFMVYTGKGEGGSAMRLSELGIWPDERLEALTPVIISGAEITVKEDYVYGRPPDQKKPWSLFPLDSPALTVYNLINGMTTLLEIADALSHATGWDKDRGFAYTRGTFLYLVLAGICIPKP